MEWTARLPTLRAALRPEYAHRPSQVWRRLRRNSRLRDDAVKLAWGLPVAVTRRTHVGEEILNHGVSDRIVPETLWRLLDPGESAVDVGANLGQNTSIMALRSMGGTIHSFEPHPMLFELLTENERRWKATGVAGIRPQAQALSSTVRTATLFECVDLGGNSLERDPPNPNRPETLASFVVECTTLDDHLAGEPVSLLKIDVEGHELAVLHGARATLTSAACRDVVFEDHGPHPSPVRKLLLELGYEVFGLYPAWWRPLLVSRAALRLEAANYTTNFLATRDPDRAAQRLSHSGWRCLRRLSGLR